MEINLPTIYSDLTYKEKIYVRSLYSEQQEGKCMFCLNELTDEPSVNSSNKTITPSLYPSNFFHYKIHLQHCHKTGLTEGVVHAHCNAVLWEYYNK